MASASLSIFFTNIINPISDKKVQFISNAALVIQDDKILDFGESYKMVKKYIDKNPKIFDRQKYLCIPSFFDMHFHWVQDDVRLMPKDSLLEWLANYTWPYEAKFKSREYTDKKAKLFKDELIQNGTLGGACYASIHAHSVDLALHEFVGDFIIGNVLMTMNSPKYLSQTPEEAVNLVNELSKKYKNKYALTPRFAPTVHPEVMQKTAIIAKKNKSFIQTHLSETKNEIEYVLSIYRKFEAFKNIESYTEIYNKTGILSDKTIMGHGIYLSGKELKILANKKTAICHCPTSNAPVEQLGLGSGLFNFEQTEKYKVNWALGSDIGGGPYLSMLDVMNSFVIQNKKINKNATYTKALFHSTLAGARILNIDDKCGSLNKNKFANFIFLPIDKINNKDDAEKVLKRFFKKIGSKRSAFDHVVAETYYKGKKLFSKIA